MLLLDANCSSSRTRQKKKTRVNASLTSAGPGKSGARAAIHIRKTQIPPLLKSVIFRPVLMFSISPPCALNVTRFPAAVNCDAAIGGGARHRQFENPRRARGLHRCGTELSAGQASACEKTRSRAWQYLRYDHCRTLLGLHTNLFVAPF